jgi:hypothetical protein
LPSSSTTGTPPSYPETHTRNNSMRYDSFFCMLTSIPKPSRTSTHRPPRFQ